jgi:hypothetical protein
LAQGIALSSSPSTTKEKKKEFKGESDVRFKQIYYDTQRDRVWVWKRCSTLSSVRHSHVLDYTLEILICIQFLCSDCLANQSLTLALYSEPI